MHFEGDFYHTRLLERTAEGFTAEVELNPDHAIYAGHFPSQPVVPGVCTMTILRELLAEVLERKIFFRSVRECKFVSALIPAPGLVVRIEAALSGAKVRATVLREGAIILKLQAEIE